MTTLGHTGHGRTLYRIQPSYFVSVVVVVVCCLFCFVVRPFHVPAGWQALIHGLQRHYYSIVIDYRKNELEEQVCEWAGGLLSC